MLVVFWLAFMVVTPVRAGDGTPGDEPPPPPPAEEQVDPTEPPPPPPTDIPAPEPTDVPPPPPTEVPAPTDVPVIPTEVPATEAATEEPTAEPTEEPSPTPTPEPDPAIPFDPDLDCHLIEGGSLAVAGETTWSYQDCTVTWQTENVSGVLLEAWTEAGGWQVIAVDGDDLANPDAIAAADGALTLTDTQADDDGFYTSRFFVGTQLGCTSATSATVQVQLTATSTAPVPEDEAGNPIQIENDAGELEQIPPGDTVTETTLDDLVVDATRPAAPLVSIDAASFAPVDLGEGTTATSGSFSFSYTGAPTGCDWQMSITLGDFMSGDHSIPVSGLTLTGVEGIDIGAVSTDVGTFIVAPPVDGTESGSFTLILQLDLNGAVPEGQYTSTITIATQVGS